MKVDRREFIEIAGMAAAWAAVLETPSLRAQRPLPKSEYDYVDWSWDRWKAITGAARPRLVGEQSGKAELIDLLEVKGKRISSSAECGQEPHGQIDVDQRG